MPSASANALHESVIAGASERRVSFFCGVKIVIDPEARSFYVDVLGLTEEPKPVELLDRGGVWLRSGDVSLHLGVEGSSGPTRPTPK